MRNLAFVLLAGCALDLDAGDVAQPDTSEQVQDLNGDTWTTVDNDPFTSGSGAEFNGIAISPVTHKIMVSGFRNGNVSSAGWTIIGSSNGTSFTLADNFHLAANNSSAATNIAVDASGYFYAIGYASLNGAYHAVIRRSTNDGVAWSTVYDNPSHAGGMEPLGITVDSAGRIFVSGVIEDLNPLRVRGFVIRSLDHGVTWTEVYSIASGSPTDVTELTWMCSGRWQGSPAVFAVGYVTPTDPRQYEVAEVSTDGGTTWTTALSVSYLDGSAGTGCAGTPTGSHVVFTGTDFDSTQSRYHAIDLDTTNITTTEDIVATPNQFHSQANGGIFLGSRLYTFGTTWGTLNGNWRARFSDDGGASWLDSENWHFTGATDDATIAYAAANDSSRGFFIVGTAEDSTGRYHGIVRHRD